MGISADGQHARAYNALLRQDDVLDAYAANLKIILNLMLPGKLPDSLGKTCRLNILVWRKMIRHQGNLCIIKHRLANLLKLLDGRRSSYIICQHHIQLAENQLTGRYRLQACMSGKNFLGHIHTHNIHLS